MTERETVRETDIQGSTELVLNKKSWSHGRNS